MNACVLRECTRLNFRMANPAPEAQVIIPYKTLCELLQAGEEVKQLRTEVKKLSTQVGALRIIQGQCIEKIGELKKLL